jgi:hypothetical protein
LNRRGPQMHSKPRIRAGEVGAAKGDRFIKLRDGLLQRGKVQSGAHGARPVRSKMRSDASGATPARSAATIEQIVCRTVRSPRFGMAVMSCSRPAGPSGWEFSLPLYSALWLALASPSSEPAAHAAPTRNDAGERQCPPSAFAQKCRRPQVRTRHVGDDRDGPDHRPAIARSFVLWPRRRGLRDSWPVTSASAIVTGWRSGNSATSRNLPPMAAT